MDDVDLTQERQDRELAQAIASVRARPAVDTERLVCLDCEEDGPRGRACEFYRACLADFTRRAGR